MAQTTDLTEPDRGIGDDDNDNENDGDDQDAGLPAQTHSRSWNLRTNHRRHPWRLATIIPAA
jgi:hypothetical protein